MSRVRNHPRVAIWLLALLSLSAPTLAAGAEPIRLGVEVIYASNEGQRVDPSLAGVERQLRASFRYSSYQRIGSHELVRPIGQQGTVPLPGGRTLLLAPQGISGGSVVLLASIQDGGRILLNTELKLANGGTILVGGPAHQSGVLILAITAATP
ncbi:MAG: hypothetical protein HY208_00895 [Nitrospirae bacterium]|nr:hypothetical protein [Nitrospirota bacterium]